MTERIRAIKENCPSVVVSRRVELEEIAQQISEKCAIAASDVRHVLEELRNAVLYFVGTGASVKLDGLGTYSPGIDLEGQLRVNHRPDRYLTVRINLPGAFHGTIRNRGNIGRTQDELVDIWNETHPEAPVAP